MSTNQYVNMLEENKREQILSLVSETLINEYDMSSIELNEALEEADCSRICDLFDTVDKHTLLTIINQ